MIRMKAGEGCIELNHADMDALVDKEAAQIGARLRMVRNANGKSVRDFSRLVSEEDMFVRSFEAGEQRIPESYMKRVCDCTGVRYDWLVNGNGHMLDDEPDARDKKAVGDVVQALAWRMGSDREIEELELGNWSSDGLSSDAYVQEAEEDLERFVTAHGNHDDLIEMQELAVTLQACAEFRSYENGMRYGARLVFQLLTGLSGTEMDGMIQTMVAGLAGKNRAVS